MDSETFSSRFLIVDDFLEIGAAESLRASFDRHFANPDRHAADTHQVWNYWHVPAAYTYLRTDPAKLLGSEAVSSFVTRLRRWAQERLGMSGVTWPYLSLYVDGCVQGMHNDSLNGRFGYVFSLTRSERRTVGGETMLLHEGDLFRDNLSKPAAGSGLFDLVDPKFNRLLVFDDRVPHGVQRVDGPMDPLEGRIVLHGHLSEEGPVVRGELPKEAIVGPIAEAVKIGLSDVFEGTAVDLHGPLVIRLEIDAEGAAGAPLVLVDRVARGDGGKVDGLREAIVRRVAQSRFPFASVGTQATIPILFGARAKNRI